jgi:TatD DNase family protein
MLKFIDTHCHPQYLLNTEDRQLSAADFLSQSFERLSGLLMVAVSLQDFELLHSLALMSADAKMSVGIHPCHTHEGVMKDLCADLYAQAHIPEVVALGETGLDYYHSTEHKRSQLELFEYHLFLSHELKKPAIIHTRDASADTLAVLKKYPQAQGVIHCFTETKEFAKAVLDLNWMISFSGIITFKNSHELRQVVEYVPEHFILSETDAPYLSPVPFRGKQNLPIYVQYVTEQIALLKNKSIEEMAAIIDLNYQRFLNYKI